MKSPLCRLRRRLRALPLTALLPLLLLAACSPAEPPAERHVAGADAVEEPEEIELAEPMAHLQRHSAKLGYALHARNARLADFYLTETEEALEDLRRVESYEGFPVARETGIIVDPTLPPLRGALAERDWPAADAAYEALIDACNRCHAASEHEYLVIEPARGPAPFNQRFAGEPAGG